MTLRQLLQRPFWTPTDLVRVTGVSLSTARKTFTELKKELEDSGYILLTKSRIPARVVIERLNIDIDYIEKNGGLDIEIY
jgi:hypothetical protein